MPSATPSLSSSLIGKIKPTLQQNNYFFSFFFLFLVLGGVTLFLLEKGELLLYFNDNRSEIGDLFFKYATKMGEEWAYIAFVMVFLFMEKRKVLWIPLTGILVTLVSYLSKAFFQHPRPLEYYKKLAQVDQLNFIEGVHVVKGFSSFPSGHTMSAFALFTLVAFILPQKKGIAIILFLAAFLVGLSRVYLVQHFFQDVYLGGIMGVILGWLIFEMQKGRPKALTK